MKQRASHVIKKLLWIAVIGCIYGIWVKVTGIGIPCPIRLVTGLRCPACGVTHMGVSILSLHFTEAYHYNPGLCILMPAILFIFARVEYRYIRYGDRRPLAVDNILLYTVLVLLVIWGMVRNLFAL